MFNFSQAIIEKLVIHHVGNQVQEEPLTISKGLTHVADEIMEVLSRYFLHAFKDPVYYRFHGEAGLQYNEVYSIASKIFDNPLTTYENSVKLAHLLYNAGEHPNIKGGEFYVTYINDCMIDNGMTDAIGIFKSESKDIFLKVYKEDNDENYDVDAEQGINIHKLDKGCIIFNTEQEEGFKVCIVDKTNPSKDALYWSDGFLRVRPVEDQYFQTVNYLDICKGFVKDVFNSDNQVEKADQIDFLNRSIGFFKDKQDFKLDDFESDVIMGEASVCDAFRDYKRDYETKNEKVVNDEFQISEAAVRKSKKDFKSVLKLDRNFHLYIHGRRDLIEKGYDHERGMNFYKIFFNNEE